MRRERQPSRPALGMTVGRDAASNLFARLPGRDRAAPPLYVGSHLDTVAMGGAYDGVAGVAGALALAAAFVRGGDMPPFDLVVTVTRAEESVWCPVSCIGSRAARGAADGLVFAFADLVTALDRHWGAELAAGGDRAVTFGRVDAASPEHAFAKVPGRLGFCLDLRSGNGAVLERMDAVLRREIARIEARRGVVVRRGAMSRSKPVSLSARLNDRIAERTARIGREPRRMLSGGGGVGQPHAVPAQPERQPQPGRGDGRGRPRRSGADAGGGLRGPAIPAVRPRATSPVSA